MPSRSLRSSVSLWYSPSVLSLSLPRLRMRLLLLLRPRLPLLLRRSGVWPGGGGSTGSGGDAGELDSLLLLPRSKVSRLWMCETTRVVS